MRTVLVLVAMLAVLAIPAAASASYTISQRQAETDVMQAAEENYADNGVEADGGQAGANLIVTRIG
jgi:hypothetical protein